MIRICSFLFVSMICLAGCGASQCPALRLSYEEMSPESQYALAREIQPRSEHGFATACRLFEGIRRDFPYSRESLLAEIDLGFCAEAEGRPEEAISRFEGFLERNPLHPRAHHVRLQIDRIRHQAELDAVASAR